VDKLINGYFINLFKKPRYSPYRPICGKPWPLNLKLFFGKDENEKFNWLDSLQQPYLLPFDQLVLL
jgi:hypothetical protein